MVITRLSCSSYTNVPYLLSTAHCILLLSLLVIMSLIFIGRWSINHNIPWPILTHCTCHSECAIWVIHTYTIYTDRYCVVVISGLLNSNHHQGICNIIHDCRLSSSSMSLICSSHSSLSATSTSRQSSTLLSIRIEMSFFCQNYSSCCVRSSEIVSLLHTE